MEVERAFRMIPSRTFGRPRHSSDETLAEAALPISIGPSLVQEVWSSRSVINVLFALIFLHSR